MSVFPSFHQPLAGCDYRALEFFHFQTVSCFGAKAGDFLLRAAYQDATVRVAAAALGSLHRAFVRDGGGPAVAPSGLTRYALQQYSSAIHLALNRIPVTEGQSTDSILIMCVLFFCFESLHGHFRNAVQHGIAGLRILRQREERFLKEGVRLPPSIVRLMFVTIENQMLEIDWQSYLPVSIQSTLLSPSKLLQLTWRTLRRSTSSVIRFSFATTSISSFYTYPRISKASSWSKFSSRTRHTMPRCDNICTPGRSSLTHSSQPTCKPTRAKLTA